GHYERALALLAEVEVRAAELRHTPIRVELVLLRGRTLERLGRYAEAEADLRAVLRDAPAARHWSVLQVAASELMVVVGYHQRRPDEALRYREIAQGFAPIRPDGE